MSEPGKVIRGGGPGNYGPNKGKTRQELNNQLSNILGDMNEAIAKAPTQEERDRIRARWNRVTDAFWRYANNIENSSQMRNAVQAYGERFGLDDFMGSVLASQVRVPHSVYMKRNRR